MALETNSISGCPSRHPARWPNFHGQDLVFWPCGGSGQRPGAEKPSAVEAGQVSAAVWDASGDDSGQDLHLPGLRAFWVAQRVQRLVEGCHLRV